MGVLEQIELELPAQNPAVVGEDRAENPLKRRQLAGLAIVEGDLLGMFTHPHQVEAKVSLALQLQKIQPDQTSAENRSGEEGTEKRIADQKIDQARRDHPQHGGKGRQLQDRAEHDHGEVKRLLGEGVDVLGDTLVGVVDADDGVETVKGPLREIARQELLRQPTPPTQAQGVADIVIKRIDRHRRQQDAGIAPDRSPETIGIARGQGRGEFAGFLIEQHIEAGLAQQQEHQQGEQAAIAPALFRLPERPGNGDEALP